MSSRCPEIALTLALIASAGVSPAAARELRVCADPNNLPFSNQAEAGLREPHRRHRRRRARCRRRLRLVGAAARLRRECAQYRPLRPHPRRRAHPRRAARPGRPTTARATRSSPAPGEPVVARSTIRICATPRIGVQLVGDESRHPGADALARQAITDNVTGFRCSATTASPTRPRTSSMPSSTGASTSPSPGVRWRATSRARPTLPLTSPPSPTGSTQSCRWPSTSRWHCGSTRASCARRSRRHCAPRRRTSTRSWPTTACRGWIGP